MKKIALFIVLFLPVFISNAQNKNFPSDSTSRETGVLDRFGNKFSLSEISKTSSLTGRSSAAPICQAGFFELTFEDNGLGTGFDDGAQGADRRAVACQVFTDISQLIVPANNPYTSASNQNQPLVRILVKSWQTITPTPPVNAIGVASSYYLNPQVGTSGVLDGEVWKTINGGFDSYSNLANSGYWPAQNFHGYLAINFPNTSISWYDTPLTGPASASEFDLYTVILHEALHALGFNSLIDASGQSVFAPNGFPNYYSRFDTYLKDATGTPLITNAGNCYNTAFNTVDITPVTGCVNDIYFESLTHQPVLAPDPYQTGTSLSHIDAACATGSNYVMSTGGGSGLTRRRPNTQEVRILGDIGYETTTTYGAVASNTYSYFTGYTAFGSRLAGVNDIFHFGTNNYYEVDRNLSITITDILQNDENADHFDCLEIVSGGGSLSTSFGITLTSPFTYFPGPSITDDKVLLRYVPVNSIGARGNITYVFIHIRDILPACPATNCNLVCNGDFENLTHAYSKPLSDFSFVVPENTPDLFNNNVQVSNGATSIYGGCQFNPIPSPHVGGGTKYIGFVGQNASGREAVAFELNQPMTAGKTYVISYWAAAHNTVCLPTLSLAASLNAPCSNYIVNNSPPATTNCGSYTYTPIIIGPQQLINTTAWTRYTFNYTANTTFNYVLIYTSINGGYTYVYFDDFEIHESDIVVNAGTNSAICSGGNVTIGGTPTASGGSGLYNYSWSPATGLSSTTVANPIASPTSTTTYTVNVSNINGCNATVSASVIVNVKPNPAVTVPGPVTLCANNSSAATNFVSTPAGATYTWINSNTAIGLATSGTGNVPVFTATNSTGSPISATITVTPTLNGCTGTPSAYTITVNPAPTVTVPSSITVCPGANISGTSFTSNPAGATYSWTNSNIAIGLSASGTGNVPAFTTTNTSTTSVSATITAMATLNGCAGSPASYVITVNPACQSSVLAISSTAGNTSYTTPGGIINAASVSVYDNITVSGATAALTITSPDMKIAANRKIIVTNGATLVINGAWLHACSTCGFMWDGIYMDNGTHLQVINGSVIEDALNAVVTTTTGTGVPNYLINCAIFNKNATAIKIQANANDMSSNVIKNTIITCRSITTPTAGTFITNFNNLKSALSTNVLSAYPAAYTLTGIRSATGIEMTDLTYTTTYPRVGNASGGSTDLNFFDNLNYGITLVNSKCEVKNNSFKNMAGEQPIACRDCSTPNPYGIGVYAQPQTSQPNMDLVIGGTGTSESNEFYNCFRGIEINNYEVVTILNNVITCSSTPTGFIIGASIADIGIYLKEIKNNVQIKGSVSISNWKTGISISRNTLTGGTFAPVINIDGNNISANTSGYCTTAINISDLINNVNTGSAAVINNTVNNVNTGIRVSNIKNNLSVNSNSVALRYNTGTFAGVWLDGCDKASVQDNTINSLRGTYGSADNWELRGVYVKNSTNNKIYCNSLYSLGECLVFEGGCTSVNGVFRNTMKNARTGLMLRNSGVIGTQGNSTTPCDNHWINSGLNFSNGQTYVLSSVASSSILYCLNSTTALPSNNLANSTSYTPYTSPATLIIVTDLSNIMSCPANDPMGIIVSGGNSSTLKMNSLSTNEYLLEIKQLHNSYITNKGISVSSQWMMEDYIYNEIKAYSNLQEDISLNDFYNSNRNTAHGILSVVNEEIENLRYLQAARLNSSFIPSNIIEQNHQRFNSIYLAYCNSRIFYSKKDMDDLFEIANQCAIHGGNAVYQSRNLLMAIENRMMDFSDNCDQESNNENGTVKNNVKTINVYPNPTNGTITMDCNLQDNESGMLKIFDVTGQLIKTFNLNLGAKTVSFNAEQLQNGIYLYQIIINNVEVQENKLIIIK